MTFGGIKKVWHAGREMSPEFYEEQKQARRENEMREQNKKPVTQGELAKIQEEINKAIENEGQDQKTIAELKEKINAIFEKRG